MLEILKDTEVVTTIGLTSNVGYYGPLDDSAILVVKFYKDKVEFAQKGATSSPTTITDLIAAQVNQASYGYVILSPSNVAPICLIKLPLCACRIVNAV
jgi:hypothetical protein